MVTQTRIPPDASYKGGEVKQSNTKNKTQKHVVDFLHSQPERSPAKNTGKKLHDILLKHFLLNFFVRWLLAFSKTIDLSILSYPLPILYFPLKFLLFGAEKKSA